MDFSVAATGAVATDSVAGVRCRIAEIAKRQRRDRHRHPQRRRRSPSPRGPCRRAPRRWLRRRPGRHWRLLAPRVFGRQQSFDPPDKSRRRLAVRQRRPLQLPEAVGNPAVVVTRIVNDDRHQERFVGCNQVRAVDREFPLQPEITFGTIMRVVGNDRDEQRAGLDLPPDRRIPGIAAAQFAAVEPHLDAGIAQRRADARCGGRVLGCVAQENGRLRLGHLAFPTALRTGSTGSSGRRPFCGTRTCRALAPRNPADPAGPRIAESLPPPARHR